MLYTVEQYSHYKNKIYIRVHIPLQDDEQTLNFHMIKEELEKEFFNLQNTKLAFYLKEGNGRYIFVFENKEKQLLLD